ncbi:hypothetical protein D1007_47010 [Hordeum vulgare]|nr:hypothetical protein D1007_47010 [Hordeum vulgare]
MRMAAERPWHFRAPAVLWRGARHRKSLPEGARQPPRYAPDNQPLWTAYFQRHHDEQLASTNDAPVPRGLHNSGATILGVLGVSLCVRSVLFPRSGNLHALLLGGTIMITVV